ncbi:hypothetical protein [Devosia sp. SD17-2]|uniref:hypothetical protein n=1 Tax=Devosia sp. SD17-2 TaxID=2976459 RepID=UPI0023D853EC|nr:hypothetical protein [Devosia sp. SD17-2]WEJ31988.1 hypothetical protein NYQ88_13875 [Devosia sp. SD17-2]
MTDIAAPNVSPRNGKPGTPPYADVWPNRKVARVAALAAKGYSAPAIAAEISDGSTPSQIAHMIWVWGIQAGSSDTRRSYADVPVPLAAKHRTALAAEAKRRGMDLSELLQKVAVTLCRDDLFGAVLDG